MAFVLHVSPVTGHGLGRVTTNHCERKRRTQTKGSVHARQPAKAVFGRGDRPGGKENEFRDDELGVEGMRSRLEGLFGQDDSPVKRKFDDAFDGTALRRAIVDRWGVQYDIQPQKRHGRVYVQVSSFLKNNPEISSARTATVYLSADMRRILTCMLLSILSPVYGHLGTGNVALF